MWDSFDITLHLGTGDIEHVGVIEVGYNPMLKREPYIQKTIPSIFSAYNVSYEILEDHTYGTNSVIVGADTYNIQMLIELFQMFEKVQMIYTNDGSIYIVCDHHKKNQSTDFPRINEIALFNRMYNKRYSVYHNTFPKKLETTKIVKKTLLDQDIKTQPIEFYYRDIYMKASNGMSINECDIYINKLDLSDSDKNKLKLAANFKNEYKKNGIYVFKNIYPLEKSKQFAGRIWSDYVLEMPYKPEIKTKIKNVINKYNLILEPWIKWSQIDIEDRKVIIDTYPMTGNMGALTFAPIFHLEASWEAREDPVIISVFKSLYDTDDLLVNIDRISFKLPKDLKNKFGGHGDDEFLHWDSNPYMWDKESFEDIQGILALSDTSFGCIPKSNKSEFINTIIKPNIKKNDNRIKKYGEFKLLKSDDNIVRYVKDKIETYNIGPGDLVIWSNQLLHIAKKNKTDEIRYALFLSYTPKGLMNVSIQNRYKSLNDYYSDRLNSYNTGQHPRTFPSGLQIEPKLYVKNWYNFAKEFYLPEYSSKSFWQLSTFMRFANLFETNTDAFKLVPFGKGTKKEGEYKMTVKDFDPIKLGMYVPEPLTEKRKELLN